MHLMLLCSIGLIELLGNNLRKNRRLFKAFFMGLIIFLFAALRKYTVGTDVERYFEDFEIAGNMNFYDIINSKKGHDPFFYLFLKFLNYISRNPQIMLIIISLIVAVCFSVFAYYQSGNILMLFTMFICFRIYSFTLTGLRQAIAMSFTWIALVCLQNKRFFLFFLLTILGSLFHVSALVVLFVFLIYKLTKRNLMVYCLTIFLFLLLIFGKNLILQFSELIFDNRFDGYINNQVYTKKLGLTFIIYLLMFLFSCILYFTNRTKNENIKFYLQVSYFAIILGFISQIIPNFFRITYYFIIILFPLFSTIIYNNFDKKTCVIINFIFILVLASQYLILGPAGGIDNYEFFWQ